MNDRSVILCIPNLQDYQWVTKEYCEKRRGTRALSHIKTQIQHWELVWTQPIRHEEGLWLDDLCKRNDENETQTKVLNSRQAIERWLRIEHYKVRAWEPLEWEEHPPQQKSSRNRLNMTEKREQNIVSNESIYAHKIAAECSNGDTLYRTSGIK